MNSALILINSSLFLTEQGSDDLDIVIKWRHKITNVTKAKNKR